MCLPRRLPLGGCSRRYHWQKWPLGAFPHAARPCPYPVSLFHPVLSPTVPIEATRSVVGHSRRYCHVCTLVRYPQDRTLPRPSEGRVLVTLLPPICKQW